MNSSLITSLRIAMSVLALVFSFTANAYTSSGIDGYFNPTTSVVFDLTQQTFNFTNMFIPSGVTVSFSGFTSTQPIEMLAMGNIDIAGTLDLGLNSLWLETPASISVLGSIILGSGGSLSVVANSVNMNPILPENGLKGSLSVVANSVNMSGVVLAPSGNILLKADGGIITVADSRGVSICSGCSNLLTSGTITLNNGGGIIVDEGNISSCSGLSLSAVPEPESYVMMLVGFSLVDFMVRRRKSRHGMQIDGLHTM